MNGQELVQSEPNFCPQNQNGIELRLQIDITQRGFNEVCIVSQSWSLGFLNLTKFYNITLVHSLRN